MGKYSIKEVETLSGLKAHTLRIWEQRYDFIQPLRTDTNIRYYTDEQLKHILNIAFLNHRGYKISKLTSLSISEINQEIEKFYQDNSPYDYFIHGLQEAMIEFDKPKFERILNSCLLKEGIMNTFFNVLIPFLDKIGLLWVTGIINPAQEHFVTNLIRKKIIVAIDGVSSSPKSGSKRFVLFLPEGEMHEIPLLIAQYMIKSQGHDVLYMGSSLPLVDLKSAIEFTKPDYILSVITVPIPEFTVREYFGIISSSFPGLQCIVCGAQTRNMNSVPSERILVMPSFNALQDFSVNL